MTVRNQTVRTSADEAAAHAVASVEREGGRLVRWIGTIRIPDFLLFAFMVADVVPIPGGYGSEFFMSLLIVLGLFRRPKFDLGRWQLLVPLFVVMLAMVGIVSAVTPPDEASSDWRFRLLRMAAATILLFMAASGRADLRSGIAGISAAALANVPLFYFGLLSNDYGGYLTGFFGDKNYSGLVYAMIGVLSTAIVTRPRLKVLLYLAFAVPLWLTGSRTSLAAYAIAGLWILFAPRIRLLGKCLLGLFSYVVVQLSSEDFSRVGRFSDRLGSDQLRARIDAASQLKVQDTGFFGRGFGNAVVIIDGKQWFFHNSYWSALVEGGWPWTVFLVTVTVLVLFRPFAAHGQSALPAAMGAGVVLLISASRLGEVFYTVPWILAMAYGLQAIMFARGGAGESEIFAVDQRAVLPVQHGSR